VLEVFAGVSRGSSQVAVHGAHDGAATDRDALPDSAVRVAEAARLLGRDRTRVYALLRSGDLVAVQADDDADGSGPVRIERSSLERWLVAGGVRGGPLTPRNAWALIGLASGDQVFSERSLGLLERSAVSAPPAPTAGTSSSSPDGSRRGCWTRICRSRHFLSCRSS